ncbi:MAG: nucleoside deaminase [Acholeplasmatales bacterium]|jgi:tRNA(Arg) A34 adenosine deaminase TadA|nr:nucleoside deaminase [Acholeplasmataceae bacterium]MDY0115475.1 nucleoside deaminase [Acholeplasmatales bacterium]MCK9288882.1 nucleoside deaminase [Acholeplasmataceae bacterium]MCK9427476.1 nucleoside deaminase [Acholeplasmataceae bacterium]MDD4090695.1 nucleoside deaminase [Acholeplasmataceae bacterium]
MISLKDTNYLKKAIALARTSLKKGDEPFGSILVLDEKVLFEGHNEVSSGDHTRHPEFAIARWAATNLTKEERKRAIVYTSNEHCPMCAAAHGWVGLGKIVYAVSGKQLERWQKNWQLPKSPVNYFPINKIINVEVLGPIKEFEDEVKKLHQEFYNRP